MFGKWVILTGKNMFVYECDIVTEYLQANYWGLFLT